MKPSLHQFLLAAATLTFQVCASAEDIELFTGTRTADPPKVLFVLDNGANFSASATAIRCSITSGGTVVTNGTGTAATALDQKAGGVEQCALYSALQALAASTDATLKIGVMAFNATGMKQYNPEANTFSNCTGNTGGCLLMPLTDFTSTTKPRILEWIRNWQISGGSNYDIKGNNHANGAVMQESWAYFSGKTGVSGRSYIGMVTASACANNYLIFVGNAYANSATPGDQTNADNSPRQPFIGSSSAGKNADPASTTVEREAIYGSISTSCGVGDLPQDVNGSMEGRGVYALNWARYMKNHGFTTYSIGVLKPASAGNPVCNAEYAAHLTKLGSPEVGGGKFFGTTNFEELKVSIGTALSEILTNNSAFASVSLPVSVNTQGTYLNQVYIGMFRPAENFLPRWAGNLKQYRLGYLGSDLKLLDAHSTPTSAISASDTGFIAECARSYWTPEEGSADDDPYWTNITTANCTGYVPTHDSPDGNLVEKGAQGYKLRHILPSARTVKACNASCDDFVTFNSSINTTLVSKTSLGNASMSDGDRTDLIDWAIGENNTNLSEDGDYFIDQGSMRPSVHGDVVHSRPVAINFGTTASPDVTVFYGGNDGMLRAVNGNRDGGAERWSFIPTEFYGSIKRLRDNTIPISYKGSPLAAASTLPKPYGFDGPIGSLVEGTTSISRAIIYPTLRRGGSALYAINVTTPSSPDLLWKKTSAQLTGLGQTWSTPKILKTPDSSDPMLIMGGGYDTCEDYDSTTDNHNCSNSSNGSHIYVLNALDGSLLKDFDLSALKADSSYPNRGMIGDVTIVTDSATGMARYAYAADLGGNIYRISGSTANTPIGATDPANWTITKIASLGCNTTAICNPNRKFMFGPDVVEESGTFFLMIGSGDREKPLYSYTAATNVTNYFFMVKDAPTDVSWLASESGNCGGNSLICLASLGQITASDSGVSGTPSSKGWYLTLHDNEQIVTSAITLFGTITFSTHQPRATAVCGGADVGIARVYNVKYLDAAVANGRTAAPYEEIAGGGLPPSPVAGKVTLDNGTTVPFIIGANPISPLEGSPGGGTTSSSVTQPRSRVYWYIER